MGCVKMEEGKVIYHRGDYAVETTYCLYCDICGSFKVRERVPHSVLKLLSISVAIITLIYAISLFDDLYMARTVCLLGMTLALYIFAGALSLGAKCHTCGNTHISKHNVLNYPVEDRSILDIPYEETKKLHALE